MFAEKHKHNFRSLAVTVVAVLLACTMTLTAFSATDLTSTVNVSGLSVSTDGGTVWTASAGGASWSGKTSSTTSGGCNPVTTYTATNGTLTLTNNSGETKVLSFDYTLGLNGGFLKIDGESKTANGSVSVTLDNTKSVTLEATSSDSAANTTTVTLSNIKLEVQKVTITFAAPTNGSYTMNGTAITANTSVTNPSTTTYNLVATPAANHHFDGWYLGDTKVSESATWNNASFATTGTVTARFYEDYLYVQTSVPADSAYTKDQLVTINSAFFHDSTSKLVTGQKSFPGNNSAYSKTSTTKVKDSYDVQYIPSQTWSDSMGISYANTAMGDYVDAGAQESYAYARVLSDVIRIYAKENCNISFNYTANHTTGGSTVTEKNVNSYFYTYITTASNTTVAQIKGGTVYTGSGSTGTIALSKGNYLYILAEGYARNRYMALVSASQFAMEFEYSASISGFTVEYNEKKDILSAGFRDNTGNALGSGQISVNNVGYNIGSDGNMTAMTFADQASVELKVNSAPANYVHIGWAITPTGSTTTYQYTPTYIRTLTEDVTVNAIFVPKTTITMGTNGYTDATYEDFNGNALDGQYVARNADCTAYYTSLADAFSSTDTVVLLAGATINGDWEIPSGKTFVIPYGMNDPGNTTPAYGGGMGGDYCLVKLDGNLTVNGTLLVSALQNQITGATGGNPGHLIVASGKTITVSGSLYAYGPVTGDGKIETTSTAKIHETIEFSDNTVVIYVYNIYNERSSKKVFPFNTMFVNSIEVPVTYQLGATLTGHVAIRYDDVCPAEVPLIAGSGAMMNHTAGTITKYYDHAKGQFVFCFNEGSVVNTGSFSITVNATIAGVSKTITMKSSDYYIPLSTPFRFEVAGNLTINDKYKALPGMTIDVKEGGTLTIAEEAELVLYRRNDFDYRGKHANSTEQWGYTEKAYPQNPQRFNGVSYPFSFNNSNMGSAKLNVDGSLIVNGGLYVTDEEQTDTTNGITLTDDGYNYLTGTGTINMTNAKTSLTSINEVMRAAGTNDLAWDTVAVVPLKGLKGDATADEPEQYMSLSGKAVRGWTNEAGLNVWVFKIYATNITVEDSLDLYFYIKTSDIGALEGSKLTARITKVFADGREDVSDTVPFADWELDGNLYGFGFSDISAKEMTDGITAVVCYDGKPISEFYTETIEAYALRTLKQDSVVNAEYDSKNALMRTALVDLLNYGAACQTHFKYGTDDLATADLTDAQKDYATAGDVSMVSELVKGKYLYAVSVSATNTLVYSVYYDFGTDVLPDGVTATVTYEDHYGNEKTKTYEQADWVEVPYGEKILYGINVTGVPMASGRSEITCTVNVNGESSVTKDSVEGYAARSNLTDTMQMMMRFVDSAKAYFTK